MAMYLTHGMQAVMDLITAAARHFCSRNQSIPLLTDGLAVMIAATKWTTRDIVSLALKGIDEMPVGAFTV